MNTRAATCSSVAEIQTAVYKGGNPPTISFIDDNGEEQFFCQLGQ